VRRRQKPWHPLNSLLALPLSRRLSSPLLQHRRQPPTCPPHMLKMRLLQSQLQLTQSPRRRQSQSMKLQLPS
jgi:hypothetical protein